MKLSGQQKAAVEREKQNVCCVAGPGSGKTRVLVERFIWLVGKGVDPRRILAITFTEKAATNIKRRLVEELTKRGNTDVLPLVQRAPVSTIHGFCSSLLREHALAAGLDPQFRLMDEFETNTERARAMEIVLNRLAETRTSELRALFEKWSAWEPQGLLLAVHDAVRMAGGIGLLNLEPPLDSAQIVGEMVRLVQEGVSLMETTTPKKAERKERLLAWLAAASTSEPFAWLRSFEVDFKGVRREDPSRAPLELAREEMLPKAISAVIGEMHKEQRATLREILTTFDAEYASQKRAAAALDFTDLEEKALALLSGDAVVRKETSERYEAVLMDELQDTNPLQWKIVDLVRRDPRFFAVGDINQSIYGFRHAAPGLFEQFQADFERNELIVDRLETNYRTRPEILAVVSRVAEQCPGVRPHRLLEREDAFSPKSAPSVEVQVFERADQEAESYEAEWLAARLAALGSELGVGWGEMAVLARKTAPLARMEEALGRAGVPSVLTGTGNYYEQQEVLDLLNWLRVLDTPSNEIALYGLLRSPFFGHADEEMFALKVRGEWPPVTSMAKIESLRGLREETSIARLLALDVDDCGYLRNATPTQRANVEKFFDLIRAYESRKPGLISEWVAEMEQLRASGGESNAATAGTVDAVQLMSVHKAKGLEFKVVAMFGMHGEPKTDNEPLSWTREHGLGASWFPPGESKAVCDIRNDLNRSSRKNLNASEEDRLLYVAMTRAEEHLVFSWTKARRKASTWARTVEQALALDLDTEAGLSRIQDDVLVTVCQGLPEIPAVVAPSAIPEVVELDRLADEPQASPAIGVTALTHFLDCPRKSLLGRVLGYWGGEDSGLGGSGAMARGTEIHELLAGVEVANQSAESVALINAFQTSDLGRRAGRARRVEREFDFLVSVEGTLVRGSIDLWFEEDDGQVVVVDYKTGKHISTELMNAYQAQIWLYALALERLLGKLPERGYLALLDRGETVEVVLGEEARRNAAEVVANFVQAEKEGLFELNPGERCGWCRFYRNGCESPWARED